jgi:uncharacterized caspase-like protein
MRLQMHGGMRRHLKIILALLAMLACVPLSQADATATERRLALVIGNASYKTRPLATAVSDAALIAQTLQTAGFDVVGARDLDLGLLRKAIGDFTDKIARTGPGATVVVYFSGYAVQLAGENYLIPIGSDISGVAELPARASSVTELMHALAKLKASSTFIVLDAARPGPFVLPGQAGGLAWTEPEAAMLIAFSAAPGTLARDTAEGYGAYAKALSEMIREGDLTPENLFERVRLRVHDLSRGAQIPWSASKIQAQFRFFERSSGAPSRTDAPGRTAQLRFQPMRALGVQQAYLVTLLRDTFDAYADFVADYWQDPMARRVRALLAARRESVTWRRTCQANEASAYWTYLERYPHGPHVADADRLLAKMGAATTPPSKFARVDYDVPPPLPDELEYVERPALMLDDRALGFETPPATPASFLEPQPQEMLNLQPPAAPATAHDLPILRLPLQVSLRVAPGVEASPNPSSRARETWVMRPAIEIPTEKRTESALTSELSSANDAANEMQPSDASGSKNPSAQGGNQEVATEIASGLARQPMRKAAEPPWFTDAVMAKNHSSSVQAPAPDVLPSAAPMFAPTAVGSTFMALLQTANTMEGIASTSSAPAAPVRPWWLTDIVKVGNRDALLQTPLNNSEPPVANPSMFAPAAAGLMLQTWRYGIPSWRAAQRTARLGGGARPRTALAGQTPPEASFLQRITGITPSPTAQSATHSPAATGNPSKPNASPAARSLTATDAKKRSKPATTPGSPSQAATGSNSAPPVSPQ